MGTESESSWLLIQASDSPKRRRVSYDSFLPRFSLDKAALRRLLPLSPEKKEDLVSLSPGHCAITTKEFFEYRRDSDCYEEQDLEEQKSFLVACSNKFKQLYHFIDWHLSRVMMDLEDYDAQLVRARLDKEENPKKNGDKTLENSISDTDSGVFVYEYPKGHLQRLKEFVHSLMESLQSTMDSLDELLGVYDHTTDSTEGASLSKEHQAKGRSLKKQLKQTMRKIDAEIYQLDTNESGEERLEEAKKQRFSVRHLLAFLLLTFTALSVGYMAASNVKSKWTIFLRLARGPLIVAYYCFLLGFNMMAWSRTNINYLQVFGCPSGGQPTPKNMFNIGSFFAVIFSTLVITFFFISDYVFFVADKALAITMWLILLVFLFNPLNVFMRRGRLSIILVQVRTLIAPFHEVLFCDNWFADQMNSLVALLFDVEYLVCYSATTPWIATTDLSSRFPAIISTCTRSNNGIRPFLFCLPALWRFLQCLRAFYDERKVGHLINAGKYSTTFFLVILAAIYSTKINVKDESFKFGGDLDPGGMVVVSLLFFSALLNSIYCFLWDVLQDWFLGCCCHRRRCLRDRLMFRSGWYYVAIVLDFTIRFANAIKMILGVAYHIAPEMVFTTLVLAEITRRFVWNFFRVEWEHIRRSTLHVASSSSP